jgi:two-component system, NtrC family, response regulator HydG
VSSACSSAALATSSKRLPAKILVADDEEGLRVGLVANLELEGYQVAAARDGAEAIQLIGETRYDLIVSDVMMPRATGVDVLATARRQGLDTPFILTSAFISEELVTRALGYGLFAMLHKPFAMNRIGEVVARALRRNVVLIVDETPASASSLAEALRRVGLSVDTRGDGASAVEFARSNIVDVCVLDLATQPLATIETCEQLRAVNHRMDIIGISQHAGLERTLGATRCKVATCLRKPVDLRQLLIAIAQVRAAAPVEK